MRTNPIFGQAGRHRHLYPVYRVDPATAARAKTEGPQWLLVQWNGNLNDSLARDLHEAILGNFNFEYAYDFIFNPDKVKGQPYTPLKNK